MYKEINIPKEKQNKWEHLFEELLSVVDFKLVRYGRGYYGLSDNQGVNLGGIEQCVFKTAEQIIDRLDCYIMDGIIEDIDRELDDYEIKCPSNEELLHGDNRLEYMTCDYYRILLEYLQTYSEEGKKFVEEHYYELEYLRLITLEFEKVNLANVSAIVMDKKTRIVSVTETYCKQFLVIAENEEEATEKVGEAWNNGNLGTFEGEDYLDGSYHCDDVTEEWGDLEANFELVEEDEWKY